MSRKRRRQTTLSAPYLRRVWLDRSLVDDWEAYPFCLPVFRGEFDQSFDTAVTIIVGENGAGKSTILEGIAGLAGFASTGGRKGFREIDGGGIETTGGELSSALRASWVPKVTDGWFFRAETFFSVARYLDRSAVDAVEAMEGVFGASVQTAPDYLSFSHGEGFLVFFEERCQKQGIYIFDEPESALSPARQMDFLKLLHRMDLSGNCQVVMATHAPMLMAYPNAKLLRLGKYGLEPISVEQTDHYRVMREFCADPRGFVEATLSE
ncbi:ATP-binding protein [Bradyrhizobium guangdongense]|uniref:AAA family ATPase n=1 Tax=Bradyrhizobium guangdongense TaxID=1325090 RepID=UPI001129137F|nr:AAA family ATPase [Bradyrhizobium guangdongense]TPQ34576.1 ATP-binding protein [Bradyrhizobium guangdongense]